MNETSVKRQPEKRIKKIKENSIKSIQRITCKDNWTVLTVVQQKRLRTRPNFRLR